MAAWQRGEAAARCFTAAACPTALEGSSATTSLISNSLIGSALSLLADSVLSAEDSRLVRTT